MLRAFRFFTLLLVFSKLFKFADILRFCNLFRGLWLLRFFNPWVVCRLNRSHIGLLLLNFPLYSLFDFLFLFFECLSHIIRILLRRSEIVDSWLCFPLFILWLQSHFVYLLFVLPRISVFRSVICCSKFVISLSGCCQH